MGRERRNRYSERKGTSLPSRKKKQTCEETGRRGKCSFSSSPSRPPPETGLPRGKSLAARCRRGLFPRGATRWRRCAAPGSGGAVSGRGRRVPPGLAGGKRRRPLWGWRRRYCPPRKTWKSVASPRGRAGVRQRAAVSAALDREQREGAAMFAACGVAQRWACSGGCGAASAEKTSSLS